jgi:hypothetical protein
MNKLYYLIGFHCVNKITKLVARFKRREGIRRYKCRKETQDFPPILKTHAYGSRLVEVLRPRRGSRSSLLSLSAASGGPSWVVPNHTGQVTMMVQNCSLVDLHIPSGTKMGMLENIQCERILPMDGKKIVEQINASKNTPNDLPKPLSPSEQKEFLAKLILNVPEEEKKLYEQIILQIAMS